jgi:hypothetical protein
MRPLLKKIAWSLCPLLISASLLGAAFNAFPEDHACTHDGGCPVCTASQGAQQLLKQAGQRDVRTLPLKGLPWGIITPEHAEAGPCPLSLSSVDLKVRLNT